MTSKEFRGIRDRLGLTQKELAEILGRSGFMAISHYETGVRKPSVLTAALMRIFDEWPEQKSLELREALRIQTGKIQRRRAKKS